MSHEDSRKKLMDNAKEYTDFSAFCNERRGGGGDFDNFTECQVRYFVISDGAVVEVSVDGGPLGPGFWRRDMNHDKTFVTRGVAPGEEEARQHLWVYNHNNPNDAFKRVGSVRLDLRDLKDGLDAARGSEQHEKAKDVARTRIVKFVHDQRKEMGGGEIPVQIDQGAPGKATYAERVIEAVEGDVLKGMGPKTPTIGTQFDLGNHPVPPPPRQWLFTTGSWTKERRQHGALQVLS